MSKTDGIIRIILALGVVALWYFNILSGTLLIIAGVAAAIFLVTGFVNFCPLYAACGLRTNSKTE